MLRPLVALRPAKHMVWASLQSWHGDQCEDGKANRVRLTEAKCHFEALKDAQKVDRLSAAVHRLLSARVTGCARSELVTTHQMHARRSQSPPQHCTGTNLGSCKQPGIRGMNTNPLLHCHSLWYQRHVSVLGPEMPLRSFFPD